MINLAVAQEEEWQRFFRESGLRLTCLGLTAKKNICAQRGKGWRDGRRVEAEYRRRTAKFIRYS